MQPVASIVFTAHNRRELLLQALSLAKRQTVPLEIIVCDDASTDGLGDALAKLHPDVRCIRSEVSRGPCYQRNLGISEAGCDIVFPLDDDSMLVSAHTVEQTLRDFADPRVALVAIPFQNILQSRKVWHQRGGNLPSVSVNFAACAHAVRRQVFLDVGGYPEDYFYMGEEGDLAIRLMDAKWRLILGSADPIHHMQPPGRRSYKPDFYGRRNTVLFYARRTPRGATIRVGAAIIGGLLFGLRSGAIKATLAGLRSGLVDAWRSRNLRDPVRPSVFAAFQACKQADVMPLDQFEALIGD